MSFPRTGLFLLFAPLGMLAAAQGVTRTGTTMVIDEGTSLRVDAPVSWSIQSGASVTNNGTIVLGPEATLEEAPGAPISGAGTERTTRTYNGPVAAVDPAGLGFSIGTDEILGTTTVERGHFALSDTSGSVSIFRWVRAVPENNSGLDATVGFRYDATELNEVEEIEQVVHIAASGDSIWRSLPSLVSLDPQKVTAFGLDSLGLFTTFEGALTTGLPDKGDALTGAFLAPNIGTGHIVLHLPEAAKVTRMEVLSMDGRVLLTTTGPVIARQGGTSIAIDRLAAGRYLLRLDGRTALPFVKP